MSASLSQPCILMPPPPYGRFATYRLALESEPRPALVKLAAGFDPAWGVVGIGAPLAARLGADVAGLRAFPSISGPGVSVPATQQALWVFVRGDDRGTVFDRADHVAAMVEGPFVLDDAIDSFTYRDGRDLTGYIDGTANPDATESIAIALLADGAGMAGSSFVAAQRWEHDLHQFRRHTTKERDALMGRNLETNEEIADAPESAHVKRAEQEDYDPPAFLVRRSMPWASGGRQGLEFIAYNRTLDTFERILNRMAGAEDGIVDGLFSFSRPVAGGYYWCPPVKRGRLDLSALKLSA